MKHDVFISFSFADQVDAEEIVNTLTTKYGITCWICTRDIDGGKRYKKLIPEAIETAKVVVFIQSESAIASKEIPKEIGMAFDADKTIIPFKLDTAPLKGDLKYDLYGVEYIDATKPTRDLRIRDLAIAIGKAIGKPIFDDSFCDARATRLQSKISPCSQYFFGRDHLLREIHETFDKGNRIVFLQGMGGIGKSEIAKQYAKANSDVYNTIIFARYTDSLVKLIADDSVFTITGMSRQIKENKEVQTDIEYANDKMNFIRNECKKDTLIIIDNFDVEFDTYFEELVETGEYKVLITTRCDPKDSRCTVIRVSEIADDNALKDIVVSYCNKDYVSIDKNSPAFEELFDITMRHTFALELIARYMEETITDLDDMVELLRQHGIQQLSEANIIRQNKIDNAYEVIKKLFKISALSQTEKRFLMYLCFMPWDGIERKYFKKWCESEVFSLQSRLIKRSMVKYDAITGKISMHPLIREVVISELTLNYGEYRNFLELFSSDLVDYIAWNYPITQKKIYYACCKNIQNIISTINKENFNVWFHMINFSCFLDTFENNVKHLKNILRIAENLFGNSSVWIGKILQRLGWCYYAYGDYKKALEYLESEAFPVLEKSAYEAPGEYIHCCCDIAKLYFNEENESGKEIANKYLSKAFDALNDEMLLKYDVIKYRATMVYLTKASFLCELGDFEDALTYCQKAMNAASALKYTELDQAAVLFSLVKIQMQLEKYVEAITHIQLAIQIYEEYSGMLNASTFHGERHCMLYIDLADCFCNLNDIQSAKEYIAEAYKISDKIYCKGHPVRTIVEKKYDSIYNGDN